MLMLISNIDEPVDVFIVIIVVIVVDDDNGDDDDDDAIKFI